MLSNPTLSRTSKVFWVVALLLGAFLALASVATTFAQETMTVLLRDVNQRVVGAATLTETDEGVQVEVQVSGMEAVGGDRRMAITDVGMCGESDFSVAGDEAYTFPNVQFYESGAADYKVTVEDLNLSELSDANGSAIVLYADTGEDTDRIICGVVDAGTGAMGDGAMMDEESMMEDEAAMDDSATMDEESMMEDEAAMDEESMMEEESAATEERTFEDAVNEGAGALLRDVQGRVVGIAIMLEDNSGVVGTGVVLSDMEPAGGDRRIAIAETSTCEAPDYSTAGDELYTLSNIQFYSSGSADYAATTEAFGINELFDADGSALVIHADTAADTDRIICGSIVPLPDLLNVVGVDVEDFLAAMVVAADEDDS